MRIQLQKNQMLIQDKMSSLNNGKDSNANKAFHSIYEIW